jgi:hypothetical protein
MLIASKAKTTPRWANSLITGGKALISLMAKNPRHPALTDHVNNAKQRACSWRRPSPRRASGKPEKASTIAKLLILRYDLIPYILILSVILLLALA